MHQSIIEARGAVEFPAFVEGERHYMRGFRKEEGLPKDMARWQKSVDQMLQGIDTDLPMYVMIDQSIVEEGRSQRKGGVHMDGYWNPLRCGHDTGRHSSTPAVRREEPTPKKRHPSSVNIRKKTPKKEKYDPAVHGGVHGVSHMSSVQSMEEFIEMHKNADLSIILPGPVATRQAADWQPSDFLLPEGILLAASAQGCAGYVGRYEADPVIGGGFPELDVSEMDRIDMEAGRVYAGNVNFLHESLAMKRRVQRTLIRINVPGWTPKH